MTDLPGGAPAPASAPVHTTLRDMAPWITLLLVVVVAALARGLGVPNDSPMWQLLATVSGVAGGAVVSGRRSEPTITTTAGDPPQTRVQT